MSNVEDVKERLPIEEVVGQYVSLKQVGSNMKGKCPFHAEKTPSFIVSPLRQTYHCFGCGVGGDIFTFVQEIEGLDFRGALKMLADKAGVVLTHEPSAPKEDTDSLFAILETATAFYEAQIKAHPKALEYLAQRGLKKATCASFRIGFAPESWSATLEHLKAHGFSQADIERAGLSKAGAKGQYDRFRSRIMFPITDSVGRVVAFSGRIFLADGAVAKDGAEQAKYINSPETALYHKSKILYGYDRARQAIRKTDFAILVEGQMDLIMSHQAGYTNTVALSGTALTHEHITLLGRMSKNLVIALDADAAGIASAGKSAKAALRADFDVKIAALPEGADPADMLADGDVSQWKAAIKNSKHVVDFLLTYCREHAKDDRSFKRMVEKEVLPYVLEIDSEIDKSHFIQRIAAHLTVSEEAVRQELSKVVRTTTETHDVAPAPHRPPLPEAVQGAEAEAVLIYLWQKSLKKPFVDLDLLQKQIEDTITPVGFAALSERLKDNSEAAFRLELLYKDEESIKQAILELLDRLDRRYIVHEIEKVGAALRKAESEGNAKAIAKNEQHYKELLERRVQLEKHL